MAITKISDILDVVYERYNGAVEDCTSGGTDRTAVADKTVVRYNEIGCPIEREELTIDYSKEQLDLTIYAREDCPFEEVPDELYAEVRRCFRYWGHLLSQKCSYTIEIHFKTADGAEDSSLVEIAL